MNKKLLFGLMSASMLFAASCTNEADMVSSVDETTVSFKVATPEIATRAYGDGETVDKLQYAVYNTSKDDEKLIDGTAEIKAGQAIVNLQLSTNNKYNIIFWAAKEGAPYTVDYTAKTITVDYTNAKSNDENRDAFYAYQEIHVTNNMQAQNVDLKRPFAQLNIGTSDYEASATAGYTPTQSYVKVKGICNTLHFDGEVSGELETEYTFDYADIKCDETFPVTGYEYLAMNYLLVGEKSSLVDIEFGHKNETDEDTRVISSVPVQRNYRTNIYGALLTNLFDVNVDINPDFDGSLEAKKLFHAAAFGGTVTLEEDVVLKSPLNVQANMTIDLNGYTISGDCHKSVGAIIKNDGNLTLIGGTISSTGENGGSALQNNGTAIVEGTTLNGAPNANGSWPSYTVNNTGTLTLNNSNITSHHGAVASYGDNVVVTMNNTNIDMEGIPGFTSHGIYTYNNGKVIVNGGNIANKATDQNASGASVINGNVEVNAGTFTGRIENYYGTPELKGGVYSVKPNNSFVVSGYKAIEKDGKYYVVPGNDDETIAIALTNEDLKAALKEPNQIVYLMPAENGEKYLLDGKISLAEGVSLIGYGEEPVDIFNDWGSNAFANQAHFTNTTIENISFSNNLVIDAGIANGDVHFKDCIFGGELAHQGVHFDSGNATIVFDNCTFVGRNMFGSSLTKVIFNNCTFLNKKASLTGADKWTGVNMWGKYEFNNCVFDTEATCNVKCDGVEAAFNNCSFSNGADITGLILNGNKYSANITFDGKILAFSASAFNNATSGSTIVLAEDIDLGTVTVGELKDVVIKGNGSVMIFKTDADTKIENVTLQNVKFEYTGATADCGVVIDADAQIKNLVIENSTFVGTGAKAGRGLSGKNNNASIEIKNCTFQDLGYPVYAWGGYETLTIENCTFENIKSWAIMPQSGFDGDLTVTGCTFVDCLGGGLIKAGTLTAGHTFTFTNNTVTGCTVAGDHNWFQFNISAGNAVIENNTKDGAVWNPGTAEGLN